MTDHDAYFETFPHAYAQCELFKTTDMKRHATWKQGRYVHSSEQ
jgi:hypothetical protein